MSRFTRLLFCLNSVYENSLFMAKNKTLKFLALPPKYYCSAVVFLLSKFFLFSKLFNKNKCTIVLLSLNCVYENIFL